MTTIRVFAAAALVALGLSMCCCGGAGSPATSTGPTVGGGGLEGPGPGTVTSATPPSPTSPVATMLPGWALGVQNATTSDIVSYAWWEPRDNVPAPFPGGHWYNLVPLGDGVNPGETRTLPPGDTGRPFYEPEMGTWTLVRAYLRDGGVVEARVFYDPEVTAVWVVRR
jgi:hypothetical protein